MAAIVAPDANPLEIRIVTGNWSAGHARLMTMAMATILCAVAAACHNLGHSVVGGTGAVDDTNYTAPPPAVPDPDANTDAAALAFAMQLPFRHPPAAGDSVDSGLPAHCRLELFPQSGSASISTGSLGAGSEYVIGQVLLSGGTGTAGCPEYPYLPPNLSVLTVRHVNASIIWQLRVLSTSPTFKGKMFVSTDTLRDGVPSGARKIAGKYMCYTCDKKACCPQSATISQSVVDAAALTW